MDAITLEELKSFLGRSAERCISIYMPAHRAGRDTEQNPIRFKNLLREVEEGLLNGGLRAPAVQEILKPAWRLLEDADFWRQQSDGLAVFFDDEEFQYYRLPLPFAELTVIANRFHLKPLLPFFTQNGHFYILALSRNQIRLLEGTRDTVDEIDLGSLPESMAEIFHYDRFEKQLQFHTGTAQGPGNRAAMFYGHDVSDEEKDRILRWFRKVDAELAPLFNNKRSPVVVASVEHLLPVYLEANTSPSLLDKALPGNPEDIAPKELHAQAWAMVVPIFRQAQERAVAEYHRLAGTGQTTVDVAEAVRAAFHGRVDTLFVAVGVQCWGSFVPDSGTVQLRQTPQPGDEDLLNLAAIQAILNGGQVYAVAPEEVPEQALLAALLRY